MAHRQLFTVNCPICSGIRTDATLRDLVAQPLVIPSATTVPGVSVPVILQGEKTTFAASFEVN